MYPRRDAFRLRHNHQSVIQWLCLLVIFTVKAKYSLTCVLTGIPYKNSVYVHTMNRGSWLEENVEKVRQRMQAGKMSIGEASRYYDIPKNTLGRRLLDLWQLWECGKRTAL